MRSGLEQRRESKKQILLAQLERGTKPVKKQPGKYVQMTEADIARVNKEIEVLCGPILKYRRKNKRYDKNGVLIKA